MNTSPIIIGEDPPVPVPAQPVPPITPPPLEPEEKPGIVRDHGVDTDEAHDIDKAAGDEGIDDPVGDDYDNNGALKK